MVHGYVPSHEEQTVVHTKTELLVLNSSMFALSFFYWHRPHVRHVNCMIQKKNQTNPNKKPLTQQ